MSSTSDIEAKVGQVIEFLRKGRLVPFVGAGMSINTGSPSWRELVKELASELGCNEYDEPADIAQYYDNLLGRKALEERVKERLLPPRPWDLEIQSHICRWPLDLIITTNFDPFLEESCRQLGIEHEVFCLDDRLSHWEFCSGLKIFKLHGDLGRGIIITEQDYQEYEALYPGALHILRTIFYTRPILFIGCSLSDPNFRRAFHWTRSVLKQSNIRRYALLPSITSHEVRMWERFGINIIPFGGAVDAELKTALKTLLERISKHCLREARSLEERQQIFEDYEAAYLKSPVLLRNLTIRKETRSSFLAIPEDGSNVFTRHDMSDRRLQTAIRRKTVYRSFIEGGANVRLIISVNPSFIEKRGYIIESAISRLLALREFIAEYMEFDNLEIVRRMPGLEYRRYTLYNSNVLIESVPLHLAGRRKEQTIVIFDSTITSHTAGAFDEKFQVFNEVNLRDGKAAGLHEEGRSPTTVVKQYVIHEIDLELEALNKGV